MIAIVDAPIDVAALLGDEETGDTGGLVLFVGTVRNATRGREVVRLEYEAYREMALAELERVAAATRGAHEVASVDIVHRVGVLQPGEAAVAIVVRAAHRGAAFEACRFAIDRLKETVPIWKKEVYGDGAVWVGDRP